MIGLSQSQTRIIRVIRIPDVPSLSLPTLNRFYCFHLPLKGLPLLHNKMIQVAQSLYPQRVLYNNLLQLVLHNYIKSDMTSELY